MVKLTNRQSGTNKICMHRCTIAGRLSAVLNLGTRATEIVLDHQTKAHYKSAWTLRLWDTVASGHLTLHHYRLIERNCARI